MNYANRLLESKNEKGAGNEQNKSALNHAAALMNSFKSQGFILVTLVLLWVSEELLSFRQRDVKPAETG